MFKIRKINEIFFFIYFSSQRFLLISGLTKGLSEGNRLTSTEGCFKDSYKVDVPAGADSVVEADPALVVRVLASRQDVLVAFVVGSFIDHPRAAFHPGRVAVAQVGVKVGAVPVTLISATLVVAFFIEDDLEESCTDKV